VDDFMVFARGDRLRLAPINLHRLLDGVLELLSHDPLGAAVQVKRNYDASLPELLADGDRLRQVFLNLARNALQAMAQGGGGSIITVSSLTATLVAEGYAPYAGAKAGINHASRIAASEFGPQRVRVNVISPTTVETPMIAALFATPGVREAMIAETPLGELPGVEDVADLLLFLASGESAFITGENIHIDGGGALRRLPRRAEMLRSMQQAAQSAAPRPQGQPQAKGTGA